MRMLLIAFALLLAASASAQDPEPDTTDWHAYYPLEVGNEWQFHAQREFEADWYYRHHIVGDSLVDGERYFVMERCSQAEGAPTLSCSSPALLRYDEDYAAVGWKGTRTDGTPFYVPWLYVCALDLPFYYESQEVTCFDGQVWTYEVFGEYGYTTMVGSDMVTGTQKSFSIFGGYSYLSGLGPFYQFFKFSPDSDALRFARIGGVEYGSVVIANEAPSQLETEILAVLPNPLRDAATLRFGLDAPERLVLEVYDVRGRLVRTDALGSFGTGPHEVRFDAAALTPGAYRFRLSGRGGFEATRGVIVTR